MNGEEFTPICGSFKPAEAQALSERYLAALHAGHAPNSTQAQAIAAEHHAHIECWFYDASPALIRGLAEMWVSDERFRRNIDRAGEGGWRPTRAQP